ncbi:MAG: histidinol-phosphatase [Clostridia bacterium]|nr:histidinol-phosphatase [Clostridia bacterium]
MDYNYHTHTVYCGHATDSAEDYIRRAIDCGIRYLGFSDHAPFRFPDGYEAGFRVPVGQAKNYFEELSRLREKYRGEIEIRIGFEMEYYPDHFENMRQVAVDFGAEYLILGQHYVLPENQGGVFSMDRHYEFEDLRAYSNSLVAAMKTGVFTYVAHPDMYNFIGDNLLYREEMRKICIASRKMNLPLELNLLGIRDNRIYPREEFWKVAGEEDAPVTFGFDAHAAMDVYDKASVTVAERMVKKYALNYIGKPDLKLL